MLTLESEQALLDEAEDEIGYYQAFNNDPVNKYDPTGMSAEQITPPIAWAPNYLNPPAETLTLAQLQALSSKDNEPYLPTSVKDIWRNASDGKYYEPYQAGPEHKVYDTIGWGDWIMNGFSTPYTTVTGLAWREVPSPVFPTAQTIADVNSATNNMMDTARQAAGTIKSVVETATNFTPLGLVASGYEGATGNSFFTAGEKVDGWDRFFAATAVAAPFILSAVSKSRQASGFFGDVYSIRYDPNFPGRPDPLFSIDTRNFTGEDFTSNGGIRNPGEFWEQWRTLQPSSLSPNNQFLLDNYSTLKLSPRVDETWISAFPEHADYFGDILVHHHVDFGPYAIPVPKLTHRGSGGPWHVGP